MKLKIEIIALIIGLIGSGLSFALVSAWGSFPVEFREFFRGGNLGGQIIGVFTLIGFAGLVLMLINLTMGLRKLWWLRSLGFSLVIFFSISFGLTV
jgi:hypothetical protein